MQKNEFLHRHADIMDEKLKYDVYLIRNKGMHHFLLLENKKRRVCFRVELTVDWGKAIFLHSDHEGALRSEDHRGQIEITLDNILGIGEQIICDYNEEYKLLEQNCQEFCNTYLIRLGLSGYITYSLIARLVMAIIAILNGLRRN